MTFFILLREPTHSNVCIVNRATVAHLSLPLTTTLSAGKGGRLRELFV